MSEWNCRSVDRWPEATWGQAAGGLGNERWIPAFIESPGTIFQVQKWEESGKILGGEKETQRRSDELISGDA